MRLPALSPGSWGDLTLNFQTLQSWLTRTGDRTSGTATVHTAAAVFATQAVSHGLGKLPTGAHATAVEAGGNTNATVVSFDATTLTVAVRYLDGVARTLDNTVYWEVVG